LKNPDCADDRHVFDARIDAAHVDLRRTEEFSGCSRSISIVPLNFENFREFVPRNWWTLKPMVEPEESNL